MLPQAHLARIVHLQGCPAPVVAHPGEQPRASALARAQQAAGRPVVSSLLHANVRLDGDLELRLLELLDGTRDRSALLAELGARSDELEDALAHLAVVGLLVA